MDLEGVELSQAAKDFLVALGSLHDKNTSMESFNLQAIKEEAGQHDLSLLEAMYVIRSLRTLSLVFDRQYGFKISPLGENLLPSLRQEATI